jgi:hypothetical protein
MTHYKINIDLYKIISTEAKGPFASYDSLILSDSVTVEAWCKAAKNIMRIQKENMYIPSMCEALEQALPDVLHHRIWQELKNVDTRNMARKLLKGVDNIIPGFDRDNFHKFLCTRSYTNGLEARSSIIPYAEFDGNGNYNTYWASAKLDDANTYDCRADFLELLGKQSKLTNPGYSLDVALNYNADIKFELRDASQQWFKVIQNG